MSIDHDEEETSGIYEDEGENIDQEEYQEQEFGENTHQSLPQTDRKTLDSEVGEPSLEKTISSQSVESQESIDMVFPHLNKKMDKKKDHNPYKVTDPIVTGSHISY